MEKRVPLGDDCFDASLAEASTLVLELADVVDLLHVSHAPERVAEYRDAMRRGERFPPVSVVRLFGRFYIADGHKRFSAYGALGHDRILVQQWSVRRWLADQRHQLARKSRQQWWALTRSPFDVVARAQARRIFWDSVGHWRRVARSLVASKHR